jgi:uncharacterized protein (DUF2384 family)
MAPRETPNGKKRSQMEPLAFDPSHEGGADSPSRDAVAIKALARVFAAWRVSGPTAAALAGVSQRTWVRRKAAERASLNQDELMRASGLIGLYKALHLYFGDELADKWPKLINNGPLFRGASPVEFMARGGLPAIIAAREYVDALRGGV